jgi:hypothetical protein
MDVRFDAAVAAAPSGFALADFGRRDARHRQPRYLGWKV